MMQLLRIQTLARLAQGVPAVPGDYFDGWWAEEWLELGWVGW